MEQFIKFKNPWLWLRTGDKSYFMIGWIILLIAATWVTGSNYTALDVLYYVGWLYVIFIYLCIYRYNDYKKQIEFNNIISFPEWRKLVKKERENNIRKA